MTRCSHVESITVTELPQSVDGCEACLAEDGVWLHLRICLNCGFVGCCDDSLNRHATRHFAETGHPVEQSFEPGEDWFWDFRARALVDGPRLADPQSHPVEQSVPGPQQRVPSDWQQQLGG